MYLKINTYLSSIQVYKHSQSGQKLEESNMVRESKKSGKLIVSVLISPCRHCLGSSLIETKGRGSMELLGWGVVLNVAVVLAGSL